MVIRAGLEPRITALKGLCPDRLDEGTVWAGSDLPASGKQIDKTNRQQSRSGRILCVLAMVTALCFVVTCVMVFHILPQITGLLPQIDGVITQMQTVLGNLEQTTEQLAALDLESMVSDVDTLVVTGQQSLEQTMEKLNTIDFAALNQAIEDLAAVIEPLAKLSNMFR